MTLIAAMEPAARPRERLVARGAEQLTDSELLAVVLGAGTRGVSALEVAATVLRGADGPTGLLRATPAELSGFAGIGPVRATLILAALELGRRAVAGRPSRGQKVTGASEVWTYFRSRLAPLSVEEFWALGLDVRHRVQSEHCLARGSLTGVEIHPRGRPRRQ
jgi:DNA repair protein RadC